MNDRETKHSFNRPSDIREYLDEVFREGWAIKPDKLVEMMNWFYFLEDYLGAEGVEIRRCDLCGDITINPRFSKQGYICYNCIDNEEGVAK